MTNYVRQNDFSAKDALPSGSAQKVIKGSDVDAEFDAIVTAIASKLDTTSAAGSPFYVSSSYGALGDDSNDDTEELQAAYDAMTSGGTLVITPGTYKITAALNFTDSYKHVIGYGAIIKQYTHTVPAIYFGGRFSSMQGLSIQFDSWPTVGETAAWGISLWDVGQSSLRDLYILQTYNGIGIAQADATGSGTNGAFSMSIDNVRIRTYRNYGIYWLAYNTGNSGSHFSNIYISNIADDGTTRQACVIPLYVSATVGSVFNQLNIEHCKPSGDLIFCGATTNFCINGLHFEGIEPTNSSAKSLIAISTNGYVQVTGVSLIGSYFRRAAMDDSFSLCKLDAESHITVTGFRERSNTVDITDACMVLDYSALDDTSSAVFNDMQFVTTVSGGYSTVWKTARTTSQPAISGRYQTIKEFNNIKYDTDGVNITGDATPSVANGTYFYTVNLSSFTITDFDDGYEGQVIYVVFGDSNTTVDFTSTNLRGNAGSDWSPNANDSMMCIYTGAVWMCNVSDNSAA